MSNKPWEARLFAIEGWVPVNKVDRLKEIIGQLNIYEEEIAIEPTDVIPTYLENHGAARLGEDLVHVYDTPSHTDKDPSMWVLVLLRPFLCFYHWGCRIWLGLPGLGSILTLQISQSQRSWQTRSEFIHDLVRGLYNLGNFDDLLFWDADCFR